MTELEEESLKRTLVYILIILGVVIMLLAFGIFYQSFHQVNPIPRPIPRQTNIDQIQGWMTIRYISLSYRVPESLLYISINADPMLDRRASIQTIAKKQNRPASQLLQIIKQTVSNYQSSHPHPIPFPMPTILPNLSN